jgi:hypothetical protein
LQAYPRLIADLETKPENRGLVSFISDHLVDFAFLTKSTGELDSHPDAGLDDEKPRTNLVQEAVTPLLPRSVLHVHSPSAFHNYDVGLRIWGLDPDEGRLQRHQES